MRTLASVLALFLLTHTISASRLFDTVFSGVLKGKEPLTEAILDDLYAAFKAEYGSIRHTEDAYISKFLGQSPVDRKAVFASTVRQIIQHNSNPENTYEKGVNAFSDMTHEEFMGYYGIVKKDQICTVAPPSLASYDMSAYPVNWDWRDFGVVTPVKNQGKCGSCWTFSTVGVIESHFKLKYGEFRNMSEQQLVDCSQAFDTFGCNGGLPSHSYEYILYNGGLSEEVNYPYMGVDQKCAYETKFASIGVIGGSVNISVSEPAIAQSLYEVGPVSVSFTVVPGFKDYKSGIYVNSTCPNGPLDVNHDVVAVGYGTENGMDYWVIKNSWGQTWGDHGFFKMQRGVNMCGVQNCGSYPQDIKDLKPSSKRSAKK